MCPKERANERKQRRFLFVKMKSKYELLEIEIILVTEDIVTASKDDELEWDWF